MPFLKDQVDSLTSRLALVERLLTSIEFREGLGANEQALADYINAIDELNLAPSLSTPWHADRAYNQREVVAYTQPDGEGLEGYYIVRAPVIAVEDKPPGDDPEHYTPIDGGSSAGTPEDPIPLVVGQNAWAGWWYSWQGKVYRLNGRDMLPCMETWVPEAPGVHFWERYSSEPEPWQANLMYGQGARVTHKGFLWESMVENNIAWEPGVVPDHIWHKVEPITSTEPEPGQVLPWVVKEAVKIGDLRTYEGKTYQCIQAHTTQVTWEPPKVANLWKPVTT